MKAVPAFAAALDDLVRVYGGEKQDLARAIGVGAPAFSRMLGGRVPSTDLLLRLAAVTRTSPVALLRAAGRGAVAALLDELYGAPSPRRVRGLQVRPADEQLLRQIRQLASADRAALQFIVRRVLGGAGPVAARRRKPRSAA